MLISYKWTQEYFEEKLPEPEALVDLLSVKSFEIEGLEKVDTVAGEDHILDVDVLPNRSHDCLSHNGIAKEISAITGLKLKQKDQIENESQFENSFKIDSENDLCRRYISCEVKNINITESPDELKSKMEALGQKSINNLVDITNIVMYEIGQPMHAFDTDKMDGSSIKIRNANKGEKITTLDKKEVDLNPSILVIADESDPLALAGIKGGKKAEVNMETKNIVLESANFLPVNVRKTSRKIGISTDSSKRFENEISPELAIIAMNRAVELILQYASNDKTTVSNKVDYYPKKWRNYRTGVSVKEVNSLLGVDFSEQEIGSAFNAIDFKYEIVNPREVILEEAQSLLDRPYKYGSSVFFDAPERFDCSSFTSYVYSLAGYTIPRMSVDQFVYSEKIDKDSLQPGDLIFANTDIEKIKTDYKSVEFLPGTEVPSGVDHVGIYVGENKVIHATEQNDAGVIEEDIDKSDRFKNIIGYGKIVKDERRFAVEAPMERLDIKTGPELIEEVGRILGYDRIEDQPVSKKISEQDFTPKINSQYQISTWLKNVMTKIGFSEIVTYSFVGEGSLEPLKPIAEDKAFVRGNLINGMESAFDKNINNADLLGLDHIKLFEIGKVFEKIKVNQETNDLVKANFPESDFAIDEKLMLSIGVKNKKGIKKPNPESLIKEAAEKISADLGVNILDVQKIKLNQDTEVIEIDLDSLLKDEKVLDNLAKLTNQDYVKLPEISEDIKYKSFSQYPFMLRDIAVWIPSENSKEEIIEIVKEVAGELLVNYKLFDTYEKDGKVSYAHRLVFQSDEKTLTDDEANQIMDEITEILNGKGWEVR
jgi:phenylalanyl-tRNA synthetase beta subunit